jgi:hypothetical protein
VHIGTKQKEGGKMKLVALDAGFNTIKAYKLCDKEKKIVWRGTQEIYDELVEGEIFEVAVKREWIFGSTTYVSGPIVQHCIDIPALGLDPLPVRHWDPKIKEYEMEQIIPGLGEDFDDDPIVNAMDLKAMGNYAGATDILLQELALDLRCIDAHVHLGHIIFEDGNSKLWTSMALRHYMVGVALGEFFLGEGFKGKLPWGMIDNRPYLRALQGQCLAFWALGQMKEAEQVAKKLLKLCPGDNLGVRFILPEIQAGVTYLDYWKKEEESPYI